MNYESFFSRAAESMRQSPIRQMGTVAAQRTDIISLAPGYPGPDSFAWDEYRSIADRVLASRDRDLLQYGPTRGYKPLIGELTTLVAQRHIEAHAEDILVTTGSQQGLDLVARTLLDPGDVVLVELPSYTGALGAFRNAQASLVGVRQDASGIEPDALDAALERLRDEGRRVKFVYVVPNFQNPTGLLMSLERRRWLLEWAAREHVLILEDDPYGALYFEDCARVEDTRPIKADDREGWVIYLSSLSKTLAPGFRTAWVVAPPPLVAKLEIAKQASDLCTGNFDQRIVCEAIRSGVLARHLPDLRHYYAARRSAMEGALRRELAGLLTWQRPRGGFFLWAGLPDPLRAPDLLNVALAHGVIFVSGHAFFVDGSGLSHIRLAFSLPSPERIDEGVRRLSLAVREAMAVPVLPGGQAPPAVAAGSREPPTAV